jgi:hypothetical protein
MEVLGILLATATVKAAKLTISYSRKYLYTTASNHFCCLVNIFLANY